MALSHDTVRYDLFGWDYEKLVELSDKEVAWYESWASRVGRNILGLACGTGRLECRLAEAGLSVTGLDMSATMLRLARRRRASLPGKVRKRLHFVRADMLKLDFDRRFDLIYIADNSFRELGTRRNMLQCLRAIRCHLKPEGRLLISERRPRLAAYEKGPVEFGWSKPVPHPEMNRTVSRFVKVKLSRDGKRIHGTMRYKMFRPSGSEEIKEFPFSAPIMTTLEYIKLFVQGKFTPAVFVGYEEKQDDGKDPNICFVCETRHRS